MNFFKDKAIELIKNMPEEKMSYVFNILQNIEGLSNLRGENKDNFDKLMSFHKSIKNYDEACSYER